MRAKIVEPAHVAALEPTLVGMHIEHEDGKEYVVREIVKQEMIINAYRQLVSITWVDMELPEGKQ